MPQEEPKAVVGQDKKESVSVGDRREPAEPIGTRMDDQEAGPHPNRPRRLLELPTDILQYIVKEVTHTNDLTALALTHSVFHDLVVPHVYSRFDIVWPDSHLAVENRIGVDALTYGLATLVMAPEVFGERPMDGHSQGQDKTPQEHCETLPNPTRRGNTFAQYTRKFSLSNGPAEWVAEYQINKEGGKMLGTLVALAVGHMPNLETFVWDMPTGILRDVFLALASLARRNESGKCRLERVWVRWHNNSEGRPSAAPDVVSPATPTLIQYGLPGLRRPSHPLFKIPCYPAVEFPTFSVLPPLTSLSVLDIDEISYAEEISVLIEKSHTSKSLRELRIGIASHAQFSPWVLPPQLSTSTPPLYGAAAGTRPGGVLGMLFSRICDAFESAEHPDDVIQGLIGVAFERTTGIAVKSHLQPGETPRQSVSHELEAENEPDIENVTAMMAEHAVSSAGQVERPVQPTINGVVVDLLAQETETAVDPPTGPSVPAMPEMQGSQKHVQTPSQAQSSRLAEKSQHSNSRLSLEILELERVPLTTIVLMKAINWPKLQTLTLLDCSRCDQLWKALRKRFAPVSRLGGTSSHGLHENAASPAWTTLDYTLTIRRLHTDNVSIELIKFLKDSLAPNSLQWLFLQDNAKQKSTVSVDTIYKAVVRRHRSSLSKLLIDSDLPLLNDDEPSSNWRKWIHHREFLNFVTSGQMSRLRELGLAISYKDWHSFLQRLPAVPTLRSLYITHIADHVHSRFDAREAGLQVLDIVSLRPTLELCYLGIGNKCFEVLECPPTQRNGPTPDPNQPGGSGSGSGSGSQHVHFELESDDDAASDGPGHDDHDGDSATNSQPDSDLDLASSRGGETGDEGDQSSSSKSKVFKLREILFYDDKVSIFKARHGKL